MGGGGQHLRASTEGDHQVWIGGETPWVGAAWHGTESGPPGLTSCASQSHSLHSCPRHYVKEVIHLFMCSFIHAFHRILLNSHSVSGRF